MGVQKQNRRKAAGFRWRLAELNLGRTCAITGLFALAGVMGYGLVLAVDRPIGKVNVTGCQRASLAQVERAVTTALKTEANAKPGFLSVDLDAVRRSVEQITWVERARVERNWPNILQVEIIEQHPVARWGESGLLNDRGELFVRDALHVPPELPQLNGPEGSEWQVAQLYLSTQGRLIEAGTRLTALTLDARGALYLQLAGGIEVRFGRRHIDERLDRFIRTALPVVNGRAGEVKYVDMRYSNGFAVSRWH